MNDNSFLKNKMMLAVALCAGMAGTAVAQQSHAGTVRQFLQEHAAKQELTAADVADWVLTDEYQTKETGVTHLHIKQRHGGIEVFNGVANFNIDAGGKVLSMGNRLVSNLAAKVNSTTPQLSPQQAIEAAAVHLRLGNTATLPTLLRVEEGNRYVFAGAGISKRDIAVRLVYWHTPEDEVRLAWDLSIYTLDAKHWWSSRIDAVDGSLLSANDWVVSCNFGECNHPQHQLNHQQNYPSPQLNNLLPDQYNVFALPTESPNHGGRSLVVNPAHPTASPFGWHDVNGVAGAEYTITRGNNVYAAEDTDDDDVPGFSPDGSATLNFDFPLNINQNPANYQDVAITNLFYMNNMLHDVLHVYGFDEQSGNFQQNNYGNGGLDGDYVQADAQDGGGTDNANFGTPPDGDNPRMQMYLWTTTGSSATTVDISAPAGIAGSYTAAEATFGPGLSSPITGTFVLVVDNTIDINDGCDVITNAAALNGNIAVLLRGACNFAAKVENAELAGAIAVVVINNQAGAPIAMGGASTAGIPSVMISQADGNLILAQLNGGNTVTGTLNLPSGGSFDKDGDFDNGVIAHEYGHGLSTRLTGGPSNSDCLYGDEQMGEGWSDWLATVLTMQPSHTAATPRPMGTYASGEPITGIGIRPAPYTTDMGVNGYTYGDVSNQNISIPHGVGFVWATMIWDMTWAFIDQYGYDADVFNGTGGNNMAMYLVIDAMKLQPCEPGFVDGRDAILLADQNRYGGANQCLIWEAFARRGLGYSADQGSSQSRSDQTEAFDLPPTCMTPTNAPVAAFANSLASSCGGLVTFDDNSTDIPQQWAWNFGDGNTSTAQNPSHVYATSGTYTVTLIVTNTLGADTTTQTVTIQYPPTPSVGNATICAGNSATLNASGTGTIQWYANGSLVFTGNTFNTPTLTASTAYQVANTLSSPAQFVGPQNTNFGGGGYHGSTFTGTVDFQAYQALSIVSAWVDADGAGDRTLYLWDDLSGAGNVIDQITVNIPDGQSRVQLDFQVPAAGAYSIGGTGVDLYRNNSGAAYPYTISGLISLTGSSAGTDFYYYLYDLEVQAAPCASPEVTATVTVHEADFSYSPSGTTLQFTDASTGAASWAWDFGDGNTSAAQNPNHTYAGAGTYTVTLVINGTCSISYQVTVGNSATMPINADFSATLQPNPAQDITYLSLSKALDTDLRVELVAADGRVLHAYTLAAGKTQCALDLQTLVPAVYWLRLSGTAGVQTMKLVKG